VLEINPEETHLTATVTDLHIPGTASSIFRRLVGLLRDNPGDPLPD
jgi:hypothetical protein